jgi:hypothetical protein
LNKHIERLFLELSIDELVVAFDEEERAPKFLGLPVACLCPHVRHVLVAALRRPLPCITITARAGAYADASVHNRS